MSENKKAGPITFAIGLIFFGIVLLISNFKGLGIFESTLKYWPVLLIGLGVEYFVRSYLNQKRGNQESTRFHFPTVFVVLFVASIAFCGQQVSELLKDHEIDGFIREAVAGTSYNYEHNLEGRSIEYTPQTVKLSLNDLNGKVNIEPSSNNRIEINATIIGWGPSPVEAKRRAEMVKIKINEGQIINITRLKDQIENIRRPAEVVYYLRVPKGLKVEMYGSSGSVKADNLENDLYIESESGETSASNIKGNVKYEGDFGSAKFRNISGDLSVKLGAGDVNIDSIAGNLKVDSESGKIEIRSSQPVQKNYKVHNESGETKISLAGTSNVTVSANTQNGRISGTLRLKMKENSPESHASSGTAVLGKGEGTVDLSNENGSIVINQE